MEEEIKLSIRLLVKFVLFFLAALCTYTLSERLLHNPVLASAIIGLFVSFIPSVKLMDRSQLQGISFCGTFAGMCSASLLITGIEFAIMSVVGAIFYIIFGKYYHGHGGKLGMIAFISVFFTLVLKGELI